MADMLSKRFARVQFLDGTTLRGVMSINKQTRAAIAAETHIFTVDNPKFIHGDGEWGCAASLDVVARWRMPSAPVPVVVQSKFLPAACLRCTGKLTGKSTAIVQTNFIWAVQASRLSCKCRSGRLGRYRWTSSSTRGWPRMAGELTVIRVIAGNV